LDQPIRSVAVQEREQPLLRVNEDLIQRMSHFDCHRLTQMEHRSKSSSIISGYQCKSVSICG
jgi:hypothetical protein